MDYRTRSITVASMAFFAFFVAACSASSPAGSALRGEQLIFPPPPGFVEVYRTHEGNLDHVEMVPRGETVTNWSEMVTAQIFHGGVQQKTPAAFAEWLSAQWKQACPKPVTEILLSDQVLGGYPFTFWRMICEESPTSGKSEYTTAMAIAGRDSFYVVQKAWRPAPSAAAVKKWNHEFFSLVHVCDDRSRASPCPSAANTVAPPRGN